MLFRSRLIDGWAASDPDRRILYCDEHEETTNPRAILEALPPGPRAVLIGPEGLVLTVGYLVLEADDVEVTTDDDRHIPARVVAYDVATGFGLLQALAPLQAQPAPLGSSGALGAEDGLVIMSGGEDGGATPARMVSRRPFSGFWEYHLDDALFTAPQRADHSGAGLFNLKGELVGIGSLAVKDALLEADGHALPGNMFLPIDLLKPVLAELQAHGRTRASARPWLGLNCAEVDGVIRVLRVNSDSPADVAGLQPGDRIVQVDGRPVSRLDELWKRVWGGQGAERDIRLEIDRDDHRETLVVHAVDRDKTLRRPQGV